MIEKLCVVAHLDDECIWFNPESFDKIIVCFLDRLDNFKMTVARKKILQQHPLKDKIVCLGLTESNYWKDKTQLKKHQENYNQVKDLIRADVLEAKEIYTHNPWGEYNHADHILVSEAVREIALCPVYGLDGQVATTARERIEVQPNIELYRRIKKLYQDEKAWTWVGDFQPEKTLYYYKIN